MSLMFLRALHECGHAIVGKALGHEVYRIHLGHEDNEGDYCDGGYLSSSPEGDPAGERRRALVALGGYFATALYGQGLGYRVDDWDVAEGDWENFQAKRDGMTFRHARKKVIAILRARREELLALTARLETELDLFLDPHPAEQAAEVVCLGPT